MNRPFLVLLGALFLPLAACAGEDTIGDDDGSEPTPEPVGATGVKIREVAIYQGLKRDLFLDGSPQGEGVPLVQGRDAVIRVFYDTDANYDKQSVTARVLIDGADPIEVEGVLGASSKEEDIASTINIPIPGSAIGAKFTYRVELTQLVLNGTDNPDAHAPTSGKHEVTVEGPQSTFRVTLMPLKYNYDGSGRIPDTSEATVEKYRNRLLQLYPVSNVEITVHDPLTWNSRIGADGSGWDTVLGRLVDLRSQENLPDDAYYYGIFLPDDNFDSYCGFGCLLGLSLLNTDPPETGNVNLRMAIGVAYDIYTFDTAAHELGHAHGRMHADCGPGLDPGSIDQSFPYPGGQIGVWGMDSTTLELHAPTTTFDVMGYCDNNWISDYNYKALLARGKNVNLPRWHEPTARQRMAVVMMNGSGTATFGGVQTVPTGLSGKHLPATVIGAAGKARTTEAVFYAYDHLPGGMAFVPIEEEEPRHLEVKLDGVVHSIDR